MREEQGHTSSELTYHHSLNDHDHEDEDDIGSGDDVDIIVDSNHSQYLSSSGNDGSVHPPSSTVGPPHSSGAFKIRIPKLVVAEEGRKRKRIEEEEEEEEEEESVTMAVGEQEAEGEGEEEEEAYVPDGATDDDDVLRFVHKRARTDTYQSEQDQTTVATLDTDNNEEVQISREEAGTETEAEVEPVPELETRKDTSLSISERRIANNGLTMRRSPRLTRRTAYVEAISDRDEPDQKGDQYEQSASLSFTRSGRTIKKIQRYDPGNSFASRSRAHSNTGEQTTNDDIQAANEERYVRPPRKAIAMESPSRGRRRQGRSDSDEEEEYVEEEHSSEDDDEIMFDLEEEEEEYDNDDDDDDERGPYNLRRTPSRKKGPSSRAHSDKSSRPMTRSAARRHRPSDSQPEEPASYPLRSLKRPNYSELDVVNDSIPRTKNIFVDIARKYVESRMNLNLSIDRYDPIDDNDEDESDNDLELAKTDPEVYANLNTFSFGDVSELESGKKKKSSDVPSDINPVYVDKSVSWDSIGGLGHHVNALKEMVILPLLYPQIFERFGIAPPRGVIFCGPPGTGKTLVARALANSCSVAGQEISFFMRKGSDVLSKYVGEAERQLRLLFEEARKRGPSIIFFDEVDGLTPARSSTKQDYIHTSIVSTLLALMDGLDSRGQVVVIGATNRIDAIDPALRRPGRFDRELMFTLPNKNSRKDIFRIHTKKWNPAVPDHLMEEIARKTVGYCGADIKALTAEAALRALRKKYPQIYSSTDILQIDVDSIQVTKADFMDAMRDITPASHRNAIVHARILPVHIAPLLADQLSDLKRMVHEMMPITGKFLTDQYGDKLFDEEAQDDETQVDIIATDGSNNHDYSAYSDFFNNPPAYRPWLLIHGGGEGQGHNHLARALLYALEEMVLFSVGLNDLHGSIHYRSPVEALIAIFGEARKNAPSVVWLKDIDDFWMKSADLTKATLVNLLNDIPSSTQIFFITSSALPYEDLDPDLQNLLSEHRYQVKQPTERLIREMFSCVLSDVKKPYTQQRASPSKSLASSLVPAVAPSLTPLTEEMNRKRKALEGILLPETPQEERRVLREEGKWLRVLRFRLREIIFSILSNKHFLFTTKPTQSRVDYILHSRKKKQSTESSVSAAGQNDIASTSQRQQETDQQQQRQQGPEQQQSPEQEKNQEQLLNGHANGVDDTISAPAPDVNASKNAIVSSPGHPPPTESGIVMNDDSDDVVANISEGEEEEEDNLDSTPIPKDLIYMYDVLDNLEQGKYVTIRLFMKDIKKICDNAIHYTDIGNEADALRVMAKSSHLFDFAQQNVNLLPNELVKMCNIIYKRMQLRERVKKERNELDVIVSKLVEQQQQQQKHQPHSQQLVEPPKQTAMFPDGATSEAMDITSEGLSYELQQAQQFSPDSDQGSMETVLDEERLHHWFEEFVQVIRNCSINELDSIFSNMYRYIYQFRHVKDRNLLLDKLELQLERMRSSQRPRS